MNPLNQLNTFLTAQTLQFVPATGMLSWLNEASVTNMSVIRNRRLLFESLNAIVVTQPGNNSIYIDIEAPFWYENMQTLRTALMSRAASGRSTQERSQSTTEFSGMSNDQTLAIQRALKDMKDAITRKQHLVFKNNLGETMRSGVEGLTDDVLVEFFARTVPAIFVQASLETSLSPPPRNQFVDLKRYITYPNVKALIDLSREYHFVLPAHRQKVWNKMVVWSLDVQPIHSYFDLWQAPWSVDVNALYTYLIESPSVIDYEWITTIFDSWEQRLNTLYYGTSKFVVQSSLNPTTSINEFQRYTRHELSNTPLSGSIQVAERTRIDVRYIEEHLVQLRPIIEAIRQTQLSTNPTSPGAPFPSTPATTLNHIPTGPGTGSTLQNGGAHANTARPLGDGGFPPTLEGMLTRTMYNLRKSMEQQGIAFQATLYSNFPQNLLEQWMDCRVIPGRAHRSIIANSSGAMWFSPFVMPISWNRVLILGFAIFPDGIVHAVVRHSDGRLAYSFVTLGTEAVGNVNLNFPPMIPGLGIGSNVVPPPTTQPPAPGMITPAMNNERFDAINRNLVQLMRAMGSHPQIVVQATLSNEDYSKWVAGELVPNSLPRLGSWIMIPLIKPVEFEGLTYVALALHSDGASSPIWVDENRLMYRIDNESHQVQIGHTITFDNSSSGIRIINQNLVRMMEAYHVKPRLQIQAALDTVLTIADVDQVLEPPRQESLADTPFADQMNALDEWTVRNILSRPTLIDRVIWGAQPANTTLITAAFPNQWLSNMGNNTHFTNILNAFTMIKADVVFRVVVNSTSMYGGHLAMSFDFFGRLHDLLASRGVSFDLTTVSNMDPIYLDVSEGTTIELKVPFSAVSQYLSRQHAPFASSYMGQIMVHAMSDLYKAPTAADIEVRLYAYVQSPDVAVLQLPNNDPYVVPQATLVKNITAFSHSYIPGMKDVYPLALEDGFHVERSNTCRVEQIGSVYGLVGTAKWSTTTAENATIMAIDVHPMMHRVIPGSTSRRLIPKLGHLGRHFCYWHGTLQYKIQVSCSKSHAGKFYIVFESGPNYGDSSNAIEPNAHILFDVQQQHELEFDVPFASPTSRKPTYLGQPFGDIAICRSGRFRLVSADGIKSALSTTSDITVNVYMRAGPSFGYSVPRNGLQGAHTYSDVIAQVSLTSVVEQRFHFGEDFNDLYKVLRRYTPLGGPISSRTSQTAIIPVRPVIPGNLGQNSISILSAGFSFWKGSVSYKFKVASASANRCAFEIFHIPTFGIPTGMRAQYYHLIDRSAVSDLSATGSFYGSQTFHAEIDKEWEVTVPMYSAYDQLHIPLVHHTGNGDVSRKLPLLSTNNGCLIIRPILGADDQSAVMYDLSVSMSCGADFTLLAPTAFPPIRTSPGSAIGRNTQVVAQATLEINAEEQGIFDMFTDLQKVLSNLSSLTDTFTTDVEHDSTEYFSKIIEQSILKLIGHAKLTMSGWLSKMLPDVDWRLLASSFVGCALLYLLKDKLASITGKLIFGALATIMSHKVLSHLMHYVKDVMNPPIRVQVGAGFDVMTITQLCCGVVAVLLNMDFRKGLSGFVKNIGELGKSLAGINSGLGAIKIFSQFVSDNVVPSLSSEDATTLKSIMIDSVNILEEVHTLSLEEMRVACHTQKEMKNRVLKCDGRLQELYRLSLLTPTSHGIVNALRAAMTKMDKLRTEVMAYKGEDGYRVDPFHISLYGTPGIGKSAVLAQLNDDLIAYHGLPTTNKAFSRSPENVYWDNYKGQTTTIFDDLGQIAATNPPSDLSELIALKSNVPYMVHMAAVNEKGTYFTSTFILSSTNFALYNNCTFVQQKEALHRRRNILAEMQTTARIVDPGDRQPVDFDAGLFGEEGYAQFRVLNSLTAEPETDWMSYDEFTTLCCQRSEEYLRKQDEMVRRYQTMAKASPSIQAIIEARDQSTAIPGVVEGDDFVPNAEAQGLLDALAKVEDFKRRDELLMSWKTNFENASYWRDYGALTASFSDFDRFGLAAAIRTKDPKDLNRFQRVVYNMWFKSVYLQKLGATALEKARDQITLVGRHFESLYNQMPGDRKKYLASALVALGALGIGYTLYSTYSNGDKNIEKSNIPLEAFDVQPEGAEDFAKWSQANPDLIPYRFQLVEENGKQVLKETQIWRDFQDYCREQKHTRYWSLPINAPGRTNKELSMTERFADWWSGVKPEGDESYQSKQRSQPRSTFVTLPESGIDDYKTRRGADRKIILESGIDDYKTKRGADKKIILEGMIENPMLEDVSRDIFSISEEEMINYMSQDSAPPSKTLETVHTNMSSYHVAQIEAQYSTDLECSQFLQNKLLDNMGMIMHVKSGYRMRCLAIDDCYITLPKHFFLLAEANWQEGDLFKFVIRGKVYEQDFHRPRLLIKPNRDLAMYMVSSRISGARSIMSQIADRAAHGSFRTTDGELVSLAREKDGSTYINRHYLPVVSRMTEGENDRTVYPVGGSVHRLVGYTYSASTLNGDCGSILLQHNVRNPGKIVGFHVAAQTGYAKAFAELLVREELEDMKKTLAATNRYITSGSVIQTVDLAVAHGIVAQGSISKQFSHMNEKVTILGSVPKAYQKRVPTETEIKPSPLQGVIDIEPLTEPAILSVKDPRCLSGRDPLIKTVGDYGLDSKPFPTVHLKIITEHQIAKLRKYDGYINRRVLSLQEAINGIPGVDYADAMNMKSAEGSFWNLSRPFWAHNKSWMFINTVPEGERPIYKIDVESGLLHKLVHRLREAREGRRVLSTSFECLKDERRGHKKTRPPPNATPEEIANFTPGTRSFSILPVDYNILVRQYFWDFAAMIMKHRGSLGPQVGIDPCSIEWTGLIKRLLATSKMGFAGDYSNYDRQTPAEFMDVACDIINGWYDDGPANAQIRKVLMGEAYDRMSIVRNAFVHIDKGLPSGFPLTVIVNSINNDSYKYCGWLALAPTELCTLDKCDELVDSVYYGDDNDHAVDPRAASFFNMKTLGRFLEGHGVSLTDEHKNHWSVAPELVEVESTSFLKRLFVKHPDCQFYLAPLEKKSIEDRLLWITDSKYMSDEELLFENIRNSLRDAFHWGPGYFVELKTKIGKAISAKYPDPEQQRRMMADVTYGSEEYKWIQTCKGMDQMSIDPIMRDVFGF